MNPAGPDGHLAEDLGAHALGLLDAAQARAVEEHLAACAGCRREWEELRAMSDLLSGLPPEALLEGPPADDLVLQRTLRRMRGEAGARRRRRVAGLVAAAAVVLAAVLGGGVALGRSTAPVPVAAPAPGTVTVEGKQGAVAMRAELTPAAGWVRLSATVRGVPAGQRCLLVVLGADGTRAVAGSWVVPPTGEAGGVTLAGSAAVPLDEVAAVLVENEAGTRFVQVTV